MEMHRERRLDQRAVFSGRLSGSLALIRFRIQSTSFLEHKGFYILVHGFLQVWPGYPNKQPAAFVRNATVHNDYINQEQ